jgi:hypothetical protein
MKVTKDNIKDIKYIYKYEHINIAHDLLEALLVDVDELNHLLIEKNESFRQIYIDYIDTHTEYSPEWTDPCPDYYGMFTLRFIKDPSEIIGEEMTLDDLNSSLCLLINFTEFKL